MACAPAGAAKAAGGPAGVGRGGGQKKAGRQGAHCNVTATPMWRKGVICGEDVTLCNACGLRYKKGKFCWHCKEIYYEDEDKRPYGKGCQDSKDSWLGCSHCARWSHLKCCLGHTGDGELPRCPWPSCRKIPDAIGSPTSVLQGGGASPLSATPPARGGPARVVNFGLRQAIVWTQSVSALEKARWRASAISRTRNSVIIM